MDIDYLIIEKLNIFIILMDYNYDAVFQMTDNVVVLKDGAV